MLSVALAVLLSQLTPLHPAPATANLVPVGNGTNWVTRTLPTNEIYFGDGSDGNVTISSGTTTLTRNMYYNNLTISGTGSINAAGFIIYVSGILDISAAPANAIQRNGVNAVTATGGAALAAAYTGISRAGSNTGVVGNGVGAAGVAGGGATSGLSLGGVGGASGAGGLGAGGAGGATAAGGTTAAASVLNSYATTFLRGAALYVGGAGGASSGLGGGSGTQPPGIGGGGGSGGGILAIYAQVINRSGSTAVGAISVRGGNGASGVNSVNANTGGSGGGGGGGGGYVQIVYETLTGSTATNAVDVSGGNGGNGGNAVGTGIGGNGGGRGGSGRYVIINLTAGTITANALVAGANGTAGSGTTGGTGASLFTGASL